MRIKTVFILLLLVPDHTSEAQVYLGPVAGPNISWVSINDEEQREVFNVRPRLGFHAGVHASFKVRNRFFLHSSLIYSQKGKSVKNEFDRLYTHKVRYDFIEIPILYAVDFKGSIGGNKEFKWYVGAGPNISYWLGGKGTLSSSGLTEITIDELQYKIAFRKNPEFAGSDQMAVEEPSRVQLGLNLGAGIVFEPIVHTKVMFNVRYELGHSFLSKTTDGAFSFTHETDPMRVRNQGVRMSFIFMRDLRLDQRKKGKSTIRRRKMR